MKAAITDFFANLHNYLHISPKIIMIMELWLLKHYNTYWNFIKF